MRSYQPYEAVSILINTVIVKYFHKKGYYFLIVNNGIVKSADTCQFIYKSIKIKLGGGVVEDEAVNQISRIKYTKN